MRNVTLKQLRALAAVAETGSVTAAAKRLHVTPPAVTMQVQALEDLLGVPLLDRLGERFKPTDAGREVIETATRIEAELHNCAAAMEALRNLSGGRVAVGVVSTAKYFAPYALGAFRAEYPQIELSLMVGNREDIIAALKADSIDIAIMGRPPRDLQVDMHAIGDHPHIMIAPPHHPLVGRRHLKLAEFAHETFLVREVGSGTRMLMEWFFAQADLHPPISMEVGSNETVKQAVMAGLGLSFISAHTIAAELESGRLAPLDVEGLPIVRQWFLAKRSDKRLAPAAAAVKAFLVERGREFLPSVKPIA
ncbi:LysR family transcriptional regulator [Nitrospirillum viridazoti]|uniref:HTH-type transcriptional regulator CbbR n=1 Tax=Nitrospirillum viridazoti CBAmc TaxID=1441467 RepID=A0A248JVD3_9PROT|nr:LysR family transcriptional regulator [Nitrospirillum amazonense]ASG22088.1 LysR family transcriptional regulator [Nitrospirillum amazonense CBAmc]TWB32781.1 LysR family transcriptional regulator for metE and metH [Nitrospirillum amazonense]